LRQGSAGNRHIDLIEIHVASVDGELGRVWGNIEDIEGYTNEGSPELAGKSSGDRNPSFTIRDGR
jgi:hypothetical protein